MTTPQPAALTGERGSITATAAILVPALMLFLGLVVDGGLALSGQVRAADIAAEAARSGAQQLDLGALREDHAPLRLDPGRARAAAAARVQGAGDHGRVSVEGTAVTVHVTHHQPTQILRIAGITTMTSTGTATARAQRGTGAEAERGSGR